MTATALVHLLPSAVAATRLQEATMMTAAVPHHHGAIETTVMTIVAALRSHVKTITLVIAATAPHLLVAHLVDRLWRTAIHLAVDMVVNPIPMVLLLPDAVATRIHTLLMDMIARGGRRRHLGHMEEGMMSVRRRDTGDCSFFLLYESSSGSQKHTRLSM